MISKICPECQSKIKIPSLNELLKIKEELKESYPFIFFIDCCESRRVKITLAKNKGLKITSISK